MSAGTPVVASELDAFRRVLDGGAAGWLFPIGDSARLAAILSTVLARAPERAAKLRRARKVVQAYDWSVVTDQLLQVYETVIASDPRRVVAAD